MNPEIRFFVCLFLMSLTTYLIRLLPLLFIKRKIKSTFIRSFLFYVPYVVLTVMTFPTVIYATDNIVSGILAFAVCLVLAYFERGMVLVALGGAGTALISECVIRYVIPYLS